MLSPDLEIVPQSTLAPRGRSPSDRKRVKTMKQGPGLEQMPTFYENYLRCETLFQCHSLYEKEGIRTMLLHQAAGSVFLIVAPSETLAAKARSFDA